MSAWKPVTRKSPCRVCGHDTWCNYAGSVAMCRRVGGPDAVEHRDCHGEPFWIHGGGARVPVAARPERAPIADPNSRSRVYGSLLGQLPLSEHHFADLREARGISRDAIARHGFRSWPADPNVRKSLASRLYREFGDVCYGVPGWFVRRGCPALAGGPGWVVPSWDVDGSVTALHIRSEHGYYWLSSAKRGGPSATPGCHLAWPGRRPRSADRAPTLRLVEGEIKAIICANATGLPTLAVPGVAFWRHSLPWLNRLQTRRVLLCFDADWQTNPRVAAALLSAHRGLSATGRAVDMEVWYDTAA